MFDRSVVAGVCPMIDRSVCRSFRRLTESSVCRLVCVGTMVFVGCQSCSSSVRRRFVVGSSLVRRWFVFGLFVVSVFSLFRRSFLHPHLIRPNCVACGNELFVRIGVCMDVHVRRFIQSCVTAVSFRLAGRW